MTHVLLNCMEDSMSRKNAREKMMQAIYQIEIQKNYDDESIEKFIHHFELKRDEANYLKENLTALTARQAEIDKIIETYLVDWKIDRISKVDLSILRISIFEIAYCEDIPVEVSINEAVELAKKYSDLESAKFINGLLGRYVRTKERRM